MFPDKSLRRLRHRGRRTTWTEDHFDNVYGFDMTCIKNVALVEPLVDTVDGEQIVTDEPRFFEIDILTVTKEELDFSVNFKMTAL